MLLHDATSAGPSTVLRAARELLAQDMQPELSSIRAPTLVVLGERDPLIPEAIGHIVEAAIPSARTVVIPGAGHVVMYDRPREFDAALLDFLARDRGSRAAATPSGNASV